MYTQPCTGSHQPLQPTPETSTARKRCSEATATNAAHREMDSKAHPPPLIRFRSESTSSAPSMATSSCRKKRNLMWKLLPCSIQALLSVQLGRVSGPKQPDASLTRDKCLISHPRIPAPAKPQECESRRQKNQIQLLACKAHHFSLQCCHLKTSTQAGSCQGKSQ